MHRLIDFHSNVYFLAKSWNFGCFLAKIMIVCVSWSKSNVSKRPRILVSGFLISLMLIYAFKIDKPHKFDNRKRSGDRPGHSKQHATSQMERFQIMKLFIASVAAQH
jgi:hypothetical protein